MAGFLVRQLGFSTDPSAYVRPASPVENPYCRSEQAVTVTVRFYWDETRHSMVAVPGADLFKSVRETHLLLPTDFIVRALLFGVKGTFKRANARSKVPTAVHVTQLHNEFASTGWTLVIDDFWSGQPIGEVFKGLPRPVRDATAHFTGRLTILVGPGHRGEPRDIDRVHYRAPLPVPLIEHYAGPLVSADDEDQRAAQGKIRYTRFETTKITCQSIMGPSSTPPTTLTGPAAPIVACTLAISFCVVNMAL